ncbi:Hemagglutinin/amebocyte aggregation factor [Anabarilius grahami]|uniref:Hemagglutinin/amebocyte aggregation factor n=1 Tax=Anabarilius grahami TaxID=495550 RepID=A0A3N0XD98_ANAGA|nr:Hemagglutinin/amebocyte aggregation factor [Anabarilius grahami]
MQSRNIGQAGQGGDEGRRRQGGARSRTAKKQAHGGVEGGATVESKEELWRSDGSEHLNRHEDRLWKFGCKDTFDSGSDCFLSPYANDFDQPLNFVCPPHNFMAGMSSNHNNKHEDRRWQFYCCRSNGHCTDHCEWTTYVNWFDEYFHWTVPKQNYLVGAESYHENKHDCCRLRAVKRATVYSRADEVIDIY